MTAFERKGGIVYKKGKEVIVETRNEREERLLRKEFISNLKTALIIGLSVGLIFLLSSILF
jgi:hypothetical protein